MQKVQKWEGGKVVQEYEFPVEYKAGDTYIPFNFSLPLEKQIEQFKKMSLEENFNCGRPNITEVVHESVPLVEPSTPQRNFTHAYHFLEEAVSQMVDRAVQRDGDNGGKAERSMSKTVTAFNSLTGHNLTEEEGWEFMILLKLVRGRQGKFRADDYVDAAAYSGLLGECANKSR